MRRAPDCTCKIIGWKGPFCLPQCPQGLATGKRYSDWESVPDDVLVNPRYWGPIPTDPEEAEKP